MHILKIKLRDQIIKVGELYDNFGRMSRVKRIDQNDDNGFSIHFEDRAINDCEYIPISSVESYTKDYKKLEEITNQTSLALAAINWPFSVSIDA